MRPANLLDAEKSYFGDDHSMVVYWANCVMHYPTVEKSATAPSTIAFGAMDIASAASLTLSVPSEILVDGEIGPGETLDLYSLDVVAGETYMVSLRGTGEDALRDTFLYLADGDLNIIDTDDDGGDGVNSLLTFTAAYTGEYVFGVGAYPGSGLTGTYSLDIILDPGVDTVSDDFALASDLALNAVNFGFIDSGAPGPYGPNFGEVDTYTFEVEAGKIYTIEMAGGADYNSDWLALPDGELDPRLVLYNENLIPVLQSDDIAFPDDINARLSFIATESGTYYLDAFSWSPWTGGYTITAQEFDLADFSPLDAINWFSADNVTFDANNTAYVYFANPGESFGELADNGVDPLPSFGWNAFEKQQVMMALEEYEKILGVNYEITTDVNQATFRLITTTSEDYGAYFYPQDPTYGDAMGIGAFNVDSGGWNFDQQQSLLRGGYAFAVILHEFGHAHGLAHPHDNGGGSDVLLGVTSSTGSYGVYDLNQGVYTVMSYNDAWDLHPDGPSPFTADGVDNGWSGSLSAFDIAVLQERYGVINPYATGNTVYQLKDVQDVGTFYETIWDTAGTDEIRYSGNRNARIDLTAATLDYSPTGGGVVSFVDDIKGGYTIANGVVIENATGGSGADVLIGNAAANTLNGNNGDDVLMGAAGADKVNGGGGFDTASYMNALAGVYASLASNSGSAGDAAGDKYSSIEKLEGSNFGDTLISGNAADTLSGLDGDDTLTGGNGNDTLDGGDGNDSLSGGNGNDTLAGGADHDSLEGGNGNDDLSGGAGDDTLAGGNGKDTLDGGEGDDTLSGGNGRDVFAFADEGGSDVVTDFRRGQDEIDLTDFGDLSWIGASAFSGEAGELRGFASAGKFYLAGDMDGDGNGDFLIQVNTSLTTADIVFA